MTRLFGIACLGSWCLWIYLFLLYMRTRPRMAEPELGRIYAWHNHGSMAYLTRAENYALFGLMVASTILFALAVWAYRRTPSN